MNLLTLYVGEAIGLVYLLDIIVLVSHSVPDCGMMDGEWNLQEVKLNTLPWLVLSLEYFEEYNWMVMEMPVDDSTPFSILLRGQYRMMELVTSNSRTVCNGITIFVAVFLVGGMLLVGTKLVRAYLD